VASASVPPPALGCSRPGGDRVRDLARTREAACLLLGEDEVAVHLDVEDAAPALEQVRPDAEPLFQLVRQTGGTGLVISSYAVLDGDTFGHRHVSLVQVHA
jgi:hypothetical protein